MIMRYSTFERTIKSFSFNVGSTTSLQDEDSACDATSKGEKKEWSVDDCGAMVYVIELA